MRKIALVAAVFVILVSFFSAPAFAEGNAPVISSLEIIGSAVYPVSSQPDLKFRFTSDQKPEDVVIFFYGGYAGGIIKTVYSSKKEEVKTEIVEKGGGLYEVTALRKINTPPKPAVFEATIWVESGGKKSNQLKQELKVEM